MSRIRTFLILIAIFCLNCGEAQTPSDTIYHTTASLKRGCYVSVQEFLTNSPSLVDSFNVGEYERYHWNWVGTFNFIPIYADKKNKRRKNIWGFCDGENVYVFHQKEFFLLRSDSTGHYFTGFNFINYKSIPSGAKLEYAMGNHAVAERIILNKAKSAKKEYKIDLHTGWAMHPNPMFNVGKPVETLVFYRQGKRELDLNFSILLNDTLELNFVPKSYNSVKVLSRTTEVKICQGEQYSSCQTYSLNLEGLDYFKLSIPEETGIPEISQVSESEGEYYSFKAMKAQERREK